MTQANFCLHCGAPLTANAQFCPQCGEKTELSVKPLKKGSRNIVEDTPKSGKVALLLCIFFGMLGVHRFYVGKKWTGLFMLFSLGLFGVWVVFDLVLIIKNKFNDKAGEPLELIPNLTPRRELLLFIVVLMSWFAVFIGSLATLLMYMTSGLVDVVDKQLAALRAGQLQQAYYYTSGDYKNIISFEAFTRFIELSPPLKNNESISYYQRKIIQDYGYLSAVLTSKDDIKTPVQYQLIKENGEWRILNINLISNVPAKNP